MKTSSQLLALLALSTALSLSSCTRAPVESEDPASGRASSPSAREFNRQTNESTNTGADTDVKSTPPDKEQP
jgi:hypothetical protein